MSVSGLFTAYRKARKNYTCDNCGLPILKGEYYDYEQSWGCPPCHYHNYGGLGGNKAECRKRLKEARQ